MLLTGCHLPLLMERLIGLATKTADGHTGSKPGYRSILAVFPGRRKVVVYIGDDPDLIFEPYVAQPPDASRPATRSLAIRLEDDGTGEGGCATYVVNRGRRGPRPPEGS